MKAAAAYNPAMRIVLIDDSIPFDGGTPAVRPLGGAEKAFAQLASALAARGHDVTAINRCEEMENIDGVQWLPWDSPRPPGADVLIAHRKPALLGELSDAGKMVLWVWSHPKMLNEPPNQAVLERHKPVVTFVSTYQRRLWKSWRDFREAVVAPGIGESYLAEPAEPAAKPIAVVTTHPLHGMQRIIRLWRERIRPKCENAELQLFSASLAKAAMEGKVPERLEDVFEEARDGAADGVIIKAPGGDDAMAAAYRAARVHLYPVISGEMYGSTIAESQAVGLPAVVLADRAGAGAVGERVHNGRTGYLVPDTDAFVNVTVDLLGKDSALYNSLHRDARILQTKRGWDAAAIDFEALWS